MTDLTTIRTKRVLKQAQEYIDQLLEISSDPETISRLSQVQVHIHEAQIVASEDELLECSDSVDTNEYSDKIVPLRVIR